MLWLDEHERWVAAAMSAGADVDPEGEREKFDTWLTSVPEAVSNPEKYELRQALGLR